MRESADRVILIVLDSVGAGALPDAAVFGDVGSNTLGNLARARGQLNLPHLGKMGLGNLVALPGTPATGADAVGAAGLMATVSHGKDTMTGHWEMVGLRIDQPFRTYPEGFPAELIERFVKETGVPGILGNTVASGTEIIQQLGEEHMRTRKPIIYTSADSVWQIAAHEEIYPLPELYRLCEVARQILQGEHRVGRVIARPFLGTSAATFKRTANRHDYALEPDPMLLDFVRCAGLAVQAVGKIEDIFVGHGITESTKTANNQQGIDATLAYLRSGKRGMIFTNLVDFDMHYGHRRDVEGYAAALEYFDNRLPEIQGLMGDTDVLIITADHGNDPTFPGTDHTREYVPLLMWGKPVKDGLDLGVRPSLADLGATVADLLNVPWQGQQGTSFATRLRR